MKWSTFKNKPLPISQGLKELMKQAIYLHIRVLALCCCSSYAFFPIIFIMLLSWQVEHSFENLKSNMLHNQSFRAPTKSQMENSSSHITQCINQNAADTLENKTIKLPFSCMYKEYVKHEWINLDFEVYSKIPHYVYANTPRFQKLKRQFQFPSIWYNKPNT